MSPSEQPSSLLAHAGLSLAALALALFVGILIGGLAYYDPDLSNFATKTLFIVGVTLSVVCVLVGGTILAIYVFKIFGNFWWLLALFGAPLISLTTYNTYTTIKVSQDVTNVSQDITNISQDITNISQDVTNISQDITNISETKCQLEDFKNLKLIPPPPPDPKLKPIPQSDPTPNMPPEAIPPLESPSSESLQPVKNPLLASIPNPVEDPPKQADGWVYVGTRSGLEWDEKHFNWAGYNQRLPEKADILTAIGSVNLRVKFGQQAHIAGVICPGEKVQVLEI